MDGASQLEAMAVKYYRGGMSIPAADIISSAEAVTKSSLSFCQANSAR